MAGHSQFKNIMHRKGRQDAQKSKLFGKLAREITVAAKLGTPDPNMNPRLRAAIIAARQENMPKDNIERAIKKAIGGDGDFAGQLAEKLRLLGILAALAMHDVLELGMAGHARSREFVLEMGEKRGVIGP